VSRRIYWEDTGKRSRKLRLKCRYVRSIPDDEGIGAFLAASFKFGEVIS